jgi:hypothetical protein
VAEITRSFGMKVLSGLVFLSALAAIEAAGLNVMQKLTGDFGNLSIVSRSSEDYGGLGFAGAMRRGVELWQEAQRLGTMPKDIVDTLDNEMEEIFRSKADIETVS